MNYALALLTSPSIPTYLGIIVKLGMVGPYTGIPTNNIIDKHRILHAVAVIICHMAAVVTMLEVNEHVRIAAICKH